MANGDTSKSLIHKIRSRISDLSRTLYPTNQPFYDRLSDLQRQWMQEFQTTIKVITVTLVNGTNIYYIDSLNISEIVKIKIFNSAGVELTADLNTDFDITEEPPGADDDGNPNVRYAIRITNSADISAGNVLRLTCFIKADDTDIISSSNDPVIGSDFHLLLVDGVLADYSTKERPFRSLEYVEQQVRKVALNNKRKNRVFVKNINPTGKLNF